jgi:tetratricopeptide (TPR) repeat protein
VGAAGAAAFIADGYAADQDWERAIVLYRKVITDQPTEVSALTKLAAAYRSAGRTREAVPYLAQASSASPADVPLFLTVAALQAWFGQEKELAATRERLLHAYAKAKRDDRTAESVAMACSILPSAVKAELDRAVALAREVLQVGTEDSHWDLMTLGMAEYRRGNDAAAEKALLAAAHVVPQGPHWGPIATGTISFYRAMSLFRQGKPDEARKLALEAAANMRPLPADQENPLAGDNNHGHLILWLAYKEAKAMMQFDAARPLEANLRQK